MNCLIKNVKEFVLKYNKVILVFLAVSGLCYFKIVSLKMILFQSLLSIFVFILSRILLIYIYIYIYEEGKTAPFTFLTGIFAIFLATIPVLIYLNDLNGPNLDQLKLFYSIAVGTGVNYVIESLIKYVEIDADEKEKNYYRKYSSFIKFLFNSLYISEFISILLLGHFIKNNINIINFLIPANIPWKMKFFLIIIDTSAIVFIAILILEFIFVKLLKKEIKNKVTKLYT